ncbi:alpha-amylase [Candidatus Amesbacteria bacterium RIFOXYB1_FULL_44_23]|uniref:Alpha-amylase n=1 Tax=Candidatus Amesbacteria bacterium RIFOXYB1_FULL_44_23 TaxID=1797263 RepID=A0A1F4ZP50_9BACT|nr:MAG: alpha-amylase [Candidatus Amesbacteria bacterium RIFOXYB1_FULL_44_23]
MSAICLYFQVHQPYRIKKYRVFDIGNDHNYFDSPDGSRLSNKDVLQKVARKSYLPTNQVILELLKKHPEFKVAYSLSGVVMEQLEEYAPDALASFQELVATGRVELLSETYYHSLSYIFSKDEFKAQVKLHSQMIKRLFKKIPKVFRNTELIYKNELGQDLEAMGYEGILAEGADHVLEWRSPNFIYKPVGTQNIGLMLKNYRLSDDIAFRFSNPGWTEFPLTAPKFARWVSAFNGSGDIINLFMDYETFGEHQWEDTGIFEFLRHLPQELLRHRDNYFVTPSQALKKLPKVAELNFPNFVSWADVERDISAWLGNSMQDDAAAKLYALESAVLKSRDQKLISDWRRLTTSDHFYYMCTKWFSDGDVHKYFNPYDSPYEAFIAYANVLQDVKLRLEKLHKTK